MEKITKITKVEWYQDKCVKCGKWIKGRTSNHQKINMKFHKGSKICKTKQKEDQNE